MKIGLTLSGGGLRAAEYHLGILSWFADEKLLEKVSFFSTVSGGCICAGLIYSNCGLCWPSSEYFQGTVVPVAYRLLTGYNLQLSFLSRAYLVKFLVSPWRFLRTRAEDFSYALQHEWGIRGNLCDLPDPDDPTQPRWIINSCCHEIEKTGSLVRSEWATM
jgi:NTE family protein